MAWWSRVKKAVKKVVKRFSPSKPPTPSKPPLTSAPGYKAPSYTPSKPPLTSAPGYKAPTSSGGGSSGSTQSFGGGSASGSSGSGGTFGESQDVHTKAEATFGGGIVAGLEGAAGKALEMGHPSSYAGIGGGTVNIGGKIAGRVGTNFAGKLLSPAAIRAAKQNTIKTATSISQKATSQFLGKSGKLNTKAGKLLHKLGIGSGLTLAAAFLLKSAVESYGMSGWAKKETYDPFQSYTAKAVEELDEPELLIERAEILDELADEKIWETVAGNTPWINVAFWSKKATTSNIWGAKVGSAYLKHQAEALATGKDNTEVAREKEMAAWEQYDIDKINRRKEMLAWEEAEKDRDMKEDAEFRRGESAFERKQRRREKESDAEFWRQHKIAMFRLDEEERERIRLFWIEYKKYTAVMQAESKPSQLNFGLFR